MTFPSPINLTKTRLAGNLFVWPVVQPVIWIWLVVVLCAGILSGVFATSAHAQYAGGPFQGMRNSDEPVHIKADRLMVENGKGLAQFDGNVSVVQGNTTLKTSHLLVYYYSSGKDKKGKKDKKKSGPSGNIKRIEATGTVAVSVDDQKATADTMVYDMETQMVTLDGNVTISQGTNILKSCKLIIEMNTSKATFPKCDKGRTTGIFNANSVNTN